LAEEFIIRFPGHRLSIPALWTQFGH